MEKVKECRLQIYTIRLYSKRKNYVGNKQAENKAKQALSLHKIKFFILILL
jgi:hypothetical protein